MQPSQYHLPRYIRKNSTTLSALVILVEIMEFLHKMIIVRFRGSRGVFVQPAVKAGPLKGEIHPWATGKGVLAAGPAMK